MQGVKVRIRPKDRQAEGNIVSEKKEKIIMYSMYSWFVIVVVQEVNYGSRKRDLNPK